LNLKDVHGENEHYCENQNKSSGRELC
jgi:hypothetical protein